MVFKTETKGEAMMDSETTMALMLLLGLVVGYLVGRGRRSVYRLPKGSSQWARYDPEIYWRPPPTTDPPPPPPHDAEEETIQPGTPLYWTKDGGLATCVAGKYVTVLKPGIPVVFTDGVPRACEAATSTPYVPVDVTRPKEHTAG